MPVEGIGASNSLTKIAAAQPKYQKQAAPAVSTASVNTNKEQKSKKTPIVVAAVALAAIGSGVYVAKRKGWLGFEKAAKDVKDAATQIKIDFTSKNLQNLHRKLYHPPILRILALCF